jgi:hypothetical protein
MDRLTVAFFDIGRTLAVVAMSARGDRIEKLAVYPYVPGVLGELRDRGARLGIISNPGPLPAAEVNHALEVAGLWNFFEPALVIYGSKDSPRIFERAAAQAGAADRLLSAPGLYGLPGLRGSVRRSGGRRTAGGDESELPLAHGRGDQCWVCGGHRPPGHRRRLDCRHAIKVWGLVAKSRVEGEFECLRHWNRFIIMLETTRN